MPSRNGFLKTTCQSILGECQGLASIGVLAQIAGVLLTSKQYRVQIYGHTDDIGSEEYHSDLSERRARVEIGIIDTVINYQRSVSGQPD